MLVHFCLLDKDKSQARARHSENSKLLLNYECDCVHKDPYLKWCPDCSADFKKILDSPAEFDFRVDANYKKKYFFNSNNQLKNFFMTDLKFCQKECLNLNKLAKSKDKNNNVPSRHCQNCKNLILNMRPTNVTYFIDQIKEQLNILKTNIRIEKEVKIMENKDKKELEKRIKEVNASIESQIKVR